MTRGEMEQGGMREQGGRGESCGLWGVGQIIVTKQKNKTAIWMYIYDRKAITTMISYRPVAVYVGEWHGVDNSVLQL